MPTPPENEDTDRNDLLHKMIVEEHQLEKELQRLISDPDS